MEAGAARSSREEVSDGGNASPDRRLGAAVQGWQNRMSEAARLRVMHFLPGGMVLSEDTYAEQHAL